IAQSSPDLISIGESILVHHERWDGLGYPRGIKGEEIPLNARIITIIDAYDVMVNGRPYKNSMTPEEALKELQKNAGTQFDPNLVKLFLQIIKGDQKDLG
ncbi:MAG: HD domain-containing protein, partial [Atribacterota bacterium]|nr:HD domain-containing protein [Atribacterota bacterium]